MTNKEIRKALKDDGEVTINELSIIMNMDYCEVSLKGEFLFTATHFSEIADYLEASGYNS